MTRSAKIGLLLAAFACAAPAARADWIVTRDGGKFEIKGSWQVKGKMVVFSMPNGTLSSLRSEKVDFEASQHATEQAKKDAAQAAATASGENPPAAKPKKASVRVLTDKDFKKAAPEPLPATDAKDAKDSKDAKDKAKEPPAKEIAPAGSLQVLTWDRVNPPDPAIAPGVQLAGKIKNTSPDQLTEMALTANLYDEGGALVARVPATLAVSQLAAGETTTFKVNAPGVFGFAAVKFDAQGRGFRLHTATPPTVANQPDASAPPPPPPG
jgi:hypothetical protein